MPSYKLTYFPGRGRGEVARQLFHLADVSFKDIKTKSIPMSEWSTCKTQTPFGHLPVLEVDDKQLAQSYAIFRYLAKEFEIICPIRASPKYTISVGFAGDTPFKAALVDAIAEQHKDYFTKIVHLIYFYKGSDEEKEKEVKEVGIPARGEYYSLLEKIVKENGLNGHFVGSSLTWVDLLIAEHVAILLKYFPGFLDGYPNVLATVKKIESIPKLKEWIDKRPDTIY